MFCCYVCQVSLFVSAHGAVAVVVCMHGQHPQLQQPLEDVTNQHVVERVLAVNRASMRGVEAHDENGNNDGIGNEAEDEAWIDGSVWDLGVDELFGP